MKNEQSREINQPVWFDGKRINEALFCDGFLSRHKIIYTNEAFFTPDGRVTNDLPLRSEIFDELRCCAVSNIPRKISNIVELMKLAALVEDFPPETDRIHLANGTRPHPSGKRHTVSEWHLYGWQAGDRAPSPAGSLQSRCTHADPLAGFSGGTALPGGHPHLAGVHRILSDSQQQRPADDGD